MHIVWLEDVACRDVDLVGGKSANLSRLTGAFPVPPGFCLTTRVYEDAVRLTTADGVPVLPASVTEGLAAAYLALGRRIGSDEPSVAVRSSAAEEDGRTVSFAGQHETFLNVSGVSAVTTAVSRCWASAASPRALEYRRQQGLRGDGVRLAVLVQQLVSADVSAVLFSANPINGDANEVVINASWGLGESLVGGTVTPDTYTVSKQDLTVRERWIGEKARMTVPVPGGTRQVEVPRLLRARACLDDEQAAAAAKLARELEQAMGWPVDVECAWRDGALYLLQCRPITTLSDSGVTADPSLALTNEPA